jgi:hypothetical protein
MRLFTYSHLEHRKIFSKGTEQKVKVKSRLPHFLENRFTDGGEVVSLTRRPAALYPQEDS